MGYEQAENYTEVVPILIGFFGAIAGYRAGRLVHRPNPRAVRRAARWTLALLGVAGLAAVGEIVLTTLMAGYGWVFAANRVLVALPPVVLALATAAWCSMPRLRHLARATGPERDAAAPRPSSTRGALADPRLVVPVQAVGVAGVLAFYTVFVGRPVPPYTLDAVEINALLLVAAGLLWWRHSRRRRAAAGPGGLRAPGIGLRLARTAAAVIGVAAVLGAGVLFQSAASVLPASYDMGTSPNMDFGGGPADMTGMDMSSGRRGPGTVSVAQLTGGADAAGTPDDVFTLTAQPARIRLSSGRMVEAWGFNGQVPGPALRVHEGDLVQVTLHNAIPGIGVTLHWHGLDVPNAEDGVPGVTQNAVPTGGAFNYRFRVHQVGTFWYHSHQDALTQVDRGLFGALIALPRTPPPPGLQDITVLAHDWKMLGDTVTLDTADTPSTRAVPSGAPVRLRVINTGTYATDDKTSPTFVLSGTAFEVAAIDGTDLHRPGDLVSETMVRIGSGGRADLSFTMPDHPVRLTDLDNRANGLTLSPGGTITAPPPAVGGPLFDPARYGTPAPTPFTAASHFDRSFTATLDDGPGFYDGGFEFRLTINGRVFPDTPMLMVAPGDLVKETLIDRGHTNHPFHLHGHHALVLAHNGKPVTGSPWWTDTLEIRAGEIYEIAFRADNPGVWMDHCHNLQHANKGMIMHLGYQGVTEPYLTGTATGNSPE